MIGVARLMAAPSPGERSRRIRNIFDRVAYATRYGHIAYVEAMHMPSRDLSRYIDALERLIDREQKTD